MTREQIEARIAELKAKNEAATSWGAAVGARSEEIKELEGQLRAMTVQRSSAGSTEAWLDLHSHREAWRTAIEVARNISSADRDDMDEKGYWEHELRAFDRVFAALPAAPPVGLAQAPSMRAALEEIEAIADRPISGTSLQTKANRFDAIKAKARAALAAQPPAAPVETAYNLATGERDNEETDSTYFHSSAGATEVRCYGCGSPWNNLDLAVAKRNDPKIISCCPERKPLDIDAWMERAVAAEQKLRTINEPQTSALPIEAIRAAITLLARKITKLSWSRDECRRKGQDVYVANLTAQIDQLDGYHSALTGLVVSRPQHSTTKGES